MSARSKARKEVLDLLFQSDIRGSAISSLSISETDGDDKSDQLKREYARELLRGVTTNIGRIDELIRSYIQGWDFDRIPGVDRNILRIAIWELLWSQTPEAVVIDEALKLASELSTENSPTFIHGVLSKLAGVRGQIAL